jgi:regulatory protein
MMTSEHREPRRPPKGTALQYAVKLLSARPYSERKLRDKLLGRQYEAPDVREALERLRRERLINDRKYAEEFVRARMHARPRAASRMITDLLARGIPLTLAKEVVAEVMPKADEVPLAREFVRRKQAQYAGLDDDTRWRRLAGMLARRGFSYDTIREVLGKSSE